MPHLRIHISVWYCHTLGYTSLSGTATSTDTHLCLVLPHPRIHTSVWYCHTHRCTPLSGTAITNHGCPKSGTATPAYARLCLVLATHSLPPPVWYSATPTCSHPCLVFSHPRTHASARHYYPRTRANVWYSATQTFSHPCLVLSLPRLCLVLLPTHAHSRLVFCYTDVFTPISGIVTPHARLCLALISQYLDRRLHISASKL
jgi:hypothetical protein